MTSFDLYNSQTPQSPDCRTSQKCSGDIGVSEKNSVENSPWGEENPSWLIAYIAIDVIPCCQYRRLDRIYLPVDVMKNDVIHNRTATSFFIVTTLQSIFIVV